ncbi:hypothetical protein J6590_077522 [Homalodisca vitripennis]|nr:hypothetical protein J6590_077522 [Homalodisca vitripennis]
MSRFESDVCKDFLLTMGGGRAETRPRLPPPSLSLLDLFPLQDTSGNRVLCFPALFEEERRGDNAVSQLSDSLGPSVVNRDK